MSLVLSGLGKSFGPVRALQSIDLEASGRRTAILGHSGCGKTTLLRLVAGFEAPDAGRITLDGKLLADGSGAVPAHGRGIGFVSQDGSLFPHLDVAANVAFGMPRGGSDRRDRIARLLETVELDPGLASRKPDELSGGQQQRVALARALAVTPRLMLLDEPFSALDPGLREGLRATVATLLEREGIPTLLVTHDRDEALSYANLVVILHAGRLIRSGPPREVYCRPGTREAALLLGDAILLPASLSPGEAECALGRLPCDGAVSGPGEIMLRPEQIRLGRAGEGLPARVASAVYRGGSTLLRLEIVDGNGVALDVAVPSPLAPEVGATVGIEVTGQAHRLADDADRRDD